MPPIVNRSRWICLSLLVTVVSATLLAQNGKIGNTAVWKIPTNFLAKAHKVCDAGPATDFSKCFVDQMSAAGASADAVSFTRELLHQSKGEAGILTGFHAVGPIDIGWVTYPLRANTNYGLLLLNGDPRIVNVEDVQKLDHKGMEQSFQFQDVKRQFPKVNVWPGDRDGKTWPTSQTGPDGGLQFTIGYPLINGCHACAHEGMAMFTWNFDAKGKFKGTQFIGMTQ